MKKRFSVIFALVLAMLWSRHAQANFGGILTIAGAPVGASWAIII